MKPSTGWAEHARRALCVLFWLAVWQLLAMCVGHSLLLASPVETIICLTELCRTSAFWLSILFSLSHILIGFLLALVSAILLAGFSYRFPAIERLFAPLMSTVKAVPVASFVIIALVWLPSKRLSVLISFLIVWPLLYSNTLSGLRQADPKLLEMARIFRIPLLRQFRHVLLPAAYPGVRAAAATAMGLAWKSGIAAEVIGIPSGSIGEKLYKAKIYLATPDLFAWTLTIVLLSALCSRLLLTLADALVRRMERM